MKATITKDGLMKIVAETEMEAWALKCWWEKPDAERGWSLDFKLGAEAKAGEARK
jgi:hypothetical protein